MGGRQTVQVAPHINMAFSGNPAQGARGGDHTTGSGLALFVNGSNNSSVVFWEQTVTVTPNATYDFTAWGTLWFGGASTQKLKMDGSDVGSLAISTAQDAWAENDMQWTSGAATSATFHLINASTQFSSNDFALDDLTLTSQVGAVPVPASLQVLLGGLALLGGMTGLRKRNH